MGGPRHGGTRSEQEVAQEVRKSPSGHSPFPVSCIRDVFTERVERLRWVSRQFMMTDWAGHA